MAAKFPLALYTGPNGVKELQSGDTIDPASSGLTGAYVGTTDTQTLTNKSLSSPLINNIKDSSGNTILGLQPTGSAVNNLTVFNAAAAGTVLISTAGTDATIPLNIAPKGGAAVQVNGSDLITADSTTTLTNKTHVDPIVYTAATTHSVPFGAGTVGGGALCSPNGSTMFGILDTGAQSGTYLGVRSQTTGGGTPSPSMVACGPDTNINILLQPKGSGVLSVRTAAGNFSVLNTRDAIGEKDFRAISVPSGSAATLAYSIAGTSGYSAGLAPEDPTDPVDLNRIFWFPFFAPRIEASTISLTGFTICTGAANAAAGNVKVGVWSNNGNTTCYPGASGTSLVTGSEVTQAIAATAGLVIVNTSMTAALTPGNLYWIGFLFDVNTIEMRCFNKATPRLNILGAQSVAGTVHAATAKSFYNATSSAVATGWLSNYTYGALPSNTSALTASMDYIFSTNEVSGGVSVAPNLMFQLIWGS